MPFTASHPAIVLPFVRPFAPSGAAAALVIGTMVPDLAYFMPWPRVGHGSHSLPGLVTFCLPMGIAGVLAFEFVFRKPLIFLLPASWRMRLDGSRPPRSCSMTETAGAVVVALLLGALTHIMWDSLADPTSPIVAHASWARCNLITVGGYRLYVYRVIEHCGTAIGLATLVAAARRWYRVQPAVDERPARGDRPFRSAAVAAIVASVAVAGIYGGARNDIPAEWLQSARLFLHRAVVWAGRTAAVAISVYAAAWWARQHFIRDADRPSTVPSDDSGARTFVSP